MIYFITGLQRSRTAWLANFLTNGKAICAHEGMARYPTMREFHEDLVTLEKTYEHVGDSDPTLSLFAHELLSVVPKPRLVVVDRPREEVQKSCVKMGLNERSADAMLRRSERGIGLLREAAGDLLVVPFGNMDDHLEQIWNFCCPGMEYDSNRARMLSTLNVQAPMAKVYVHPQRAEDIRGKLCRP